MSGTRRRRRGENVLKHGVSFHEALAVFADSNRASAASGLDPYGGERIETVGMVEGRLLLVVHTVRGSAVRLISARSASKKERTRYA